MKRKNDAPLSASLKAGAVALVFLVLGYQVALFVHKAAVAKITGNRDHPDTVFVADASLLDSLMRGVSTEPAAGQSAMGRSAAGNPAVLPRKDGAAVRVVARRNAQHSDEAVAVRELNPPAEPESFRFDPNTVSVEDLQRLGFTLRQAQSIDNYRRKGGRFSRRSDFAKSFVVSEETYERLRDFIDIPLLDINKADSAAFDSLPGIGGWFASNMVRHREELGGYNSKEQLMNIYRMDEERYSKISDLVFVSEKDAVPFRLWSLPADSLKLHPYIRSWQTARDIITYRDHNPRELWSLDGLLSAGVLTDVQYQKLSRTLIE